MKYEIGDKVRIKSLDWYNENKASDDEIRCYPSWFGKEHSIWCGKVMTISNVRGYSFDTIYHMIEDDGTEDWTDEMIEGLVEEECPQDFIEKYCKSCGTQRCDRTKEYLNGCPYYNAYVCKKQNNTMKEESSIDLTVKGEEVKERIEITMPEGYEYVIESGKIIFTKKKKEYPKTYAECLKILGFTTLFAPKVDPIFDYDDDIIALQKLKNCRNAYWKIAGDEMGFGKPWEPEDLRYVYSFFRWDGDITMSNTCYGNNHIFEFPTEEMRDMFYENFKEEIEICKELL